jgi:hypothetical protein
MNSWYIFYVCSVLISLYSFYLLVFKTYETKLWKKTEKRIVMLNIIYVVLFAITFLPILNLVFILVFYIAVLIDDKDNFMVDSWLFKKPGQKEE